MKTKFSGMAKVTPLCLPLALSFGLIACGDDSSSGPLVGKSSGTGLDLEVGSCDFKKDDKVWKYTFIMKQNGVESEAARYVTFDGDDTKDSIVSTSTGSTASTACKYMSDKETSEEEEDGIKVVSTAWCEGKTFYSSEVTVGEFQGLSRSEAFDAVMKECKALNDAEDIVSEDKSSSSTKDNGKSASSRFGESCTAKATDDVWYGRLNDIDVVFEWDGNDAVRTFYQDMGSDSACVAMVESLCGEAPCVDDRNFTNSCDGSTLLSVSYFVDDDKEIQFSYFMDDVCRWYFHSEEFLCKFDKTDNYWILDINDYGETFVEWDGNHFISQATSTVQSFKTNNECLEAADKMSEEDGMFAWCHDETLIAETFVEGEVEDRDEAFKKAKEFCKISGDK